jgi:hypothetical protein
VVSPWWLLNSWTEGQLVQCAQNPPQYQVQKKEPRTTSKKPKHAAALSIFRECLFTFIRVAPPDWAVDFNAQEFEKLTVAHGGQLLSLKLVEALRADQMAGRITRRRKCYVVCWGSYKPGSLIDPLVAQVKRYQLCDLQEVTPIWLRTCVMEQNYLLPSTLPRIFAPSNHPLHAALDCNKEDKDSENKKKESEVACTASSSKVGLDSIRISATGFIGFERTALIQLIKAMGGVYDDSMRTSTTHLICREAKGNKFAKAVEWKRHVLSVEWLYHISIYGYYSDQNGGYEDRFSLLTRAPSSSKSPSSGTQKNETTNK